eukprot:gene6022-7236_t
MASSEFPRIDPQESFDLAKFFIDGNRPYDSLRSFDAGLEDGAALDHASPDAASSFWDAADTARYFPPTLEHSSDRDAGNKPPGCVPRRFRVAFVSVTSSAEISLDVKHWNVDSAASRLFERMKQEKRRRRAFSEDVVKGKNAYSFQWMLVFTPTKGRAAMPVVESLDGGASNHDQEHVGLYVEETWHSGVRALLISADK